MYSRLPEFPGKNYSFDLLYGCCCIPYFRATKSFSVELSQDNVVYTEVVNGVLTDPTNLGCDTPLEMFDIASTTSRYVKVILIDYYGTISVALQYVQVLTA